ncbi:type II secretion system protein GspM [Deferrisoma sp.]
MRLSDREKAIVGLGAVAVVAVGFWLGVWEPVQAQIELWERRVEAKRAELRKVEELGQRYADLQGRIQGIERNLKRSRDFSILSYLENLAKRQNLHDRIVQMKPRPGEVTRYYRENAVEIRMEKVRLGEIVNYLFQVENSPELLRIKQLQMRPRFDDPNRLDVKFQVAAYEPLEAR